MSAIFQENFSRKPTEPPTNATREPSGIEATTEEDEVENNVTNQRGHHTRHTNVRTEMSENARLDFVKQ